MRGPFLVFHNLKCFTYQVNTFRAYHLAGKHNEFISLNINVFGLGFHSDTEGVATRCAYSYISKPTIITIFLSEVWLIVNVKIIYLCNELATSRFCGMEVMGLNPVTS